MEAFLVNSFPQFITNQVTNLRLDYQIDLIHFIEFMYADDLLLLSLFLSDLQQIFCLQELHNLSA